MQNLLRHNATRLLASIGTWLEAQLAADAIRDIPLPLLTQQLMSPVVMHMLVRPAMPAIPGIDLPDLNTVCDTFTETFLRAVSN